MANNSIENSSVENSTTNSWTTVWFWNLFISWFGIEAQLIINSSVGLLLQTKLKKLLAALAGHSRFTGGCCTSPCSRKLKYPPPRSLCFAQIVVIVYKPSYRILFDTPWGPQHTNGDLVTSRAKHCFWRGGGDELFQILAFESFAISLISSPIPTSRDQCFKSSRRYYSCLRSHLVDSDVPRHLEHSFVMATRSPP